MSSNFNYVLKKIKQQAVKTLKTDVGKEVARSLHNKTEELVYEANKPTDYERTYELRDSVEHQACMGDKVRIFHNTGKINPYKTDGWNQHADVNGNDVSSMIPLWIEDGTDGSLYDRKGSKIVQKTRDEIEKTKIAQKIIKEGLRKSGFKVK